MKQLWRAGLGVVALALVAGCAGSSEARRDAEGTIAGLEESKEGMIVALRQDALEVRDAENPNAEPIEFRRTADTDLLRNDQPFSWPELAEGMPVRVSFDPDAGAEEATRIEILTGSEAEEVRRRAGGSSGWSRPDGVGSQGGAPPPVDMPGVGDRKDQMETEDDSAY